MNQERVKEIAESIANSSISKRTKKLPSNQLEKIIIRNACLKMADLLLKNMWVSVDDYLPPYGKDVFVKFISRHPNAPEKFEVGYCLRWRTEDKTVKTDSKGFSVLGNMEITHWMDVPLEGGEE